MRAVALFALGILASPALAIAGQQSAANIAAIDSGEKCRVSLAEQDEARALQWNEFDQVGEQAGSFRGLAEKGCPSAALAAYDDWLENGPGFPNARAKGIGTLHRAQLLAFIGRTKQARKLAAQAFRTPGSDDPHAEVWNIYLRGVLAFFDHDRQGIEFAQSGLRKHPDDAFARRQIGVLQGLRDCFERDYRTAMSSPCRKKR
ncbi:hypothetical protein [Tsuneonella mangrovi]|uniref:hypothetical protein n=1 Tax=Tsuneonella mangrovi TaxID=1982042 RepID=UPI000BA26633|nr:hypothetical protein [Tsuneonella mangrovi]